MEILMAYKDKSDDWFEISFDEFLDNTEGRNVCGKGWALYNLIALQKKQYSFEQFVALSLTFYLIFQAIINICVVSGLFPITGIPLTFISYGGTSLLSSLYCLGVIHRIGTTK